MRKKNFISDPVKDTAMAILATAVAILLLGACGLYREMVVQSNRNVAQVAEIDSLRGQVISTQTELLTQEESTLPIDSEYIGTFFATAYCCEKRPHICGNGNGITASGKTVTADISVAVDPEVIPLGTWLYIDGVGIRQAQDTGSAIKGNKIDVAVDIHENALKWEGYGEHKVYILKEFENDF